MNRRAPDDFDFDDQPWSRRLLRLGSCVVAAALVLGTFWLGARYLATKDDLSQVEKQNVDGLTQVLNMTDVLMDKMDALTQVLLPRLNMADALMDKMDKLNQDLLQQSLPQDAVQTVSGHSMQDFSVRRPRPDSSASGNPGEWHGQHHQGEWAFTNSVQVGGWPLTFLDIGAHQGVEISNTYGLEERGWIGLCVEPLPLHFQDRRCKLIRNVVSNHAGDAVVFKDCTDLGTDGGTGGLSGMAREGLGNAKGNAELLSARQDCREEMFFTTTMREILHTNYTRNVYRKTNLHGRPMNYIDFTSLDIEGAEFMALLAFPFETHCSRLWVIEHNYQETKRQNIFDLLTNHGCERTGPGDTPDDYFTCKCED